jgi:hypothetical protein
MSTFIEELGLDWFGLLLGHSPLASSAAGSLPSSSEVRSRFSGMRGRRLDDALTYCAGLLEREDSRAETIESKAASLIGITGVATGLITGIGGLLLDPTKIGSWLFWPATIIYMLIIVSLMWTIYLSVRVVKVGDYSFTYPSAPDIFNQAGDSLLKVKRERVASLYFSFSRNSLVVNRKATFLIGAQKWFRNAVVLLLLVALILAGSALLFRPLAAVSKSPATIAPLPSTVKQLTNPTPVVPTETSIPVAGLTRTY